MTRTKSPKGQERRRAQRVRAAIPLSIEARDSGAEALLKDISTNGLCCLYPEPLPEMTLVRMNLDIEDKALEIEGAVVRSEKVVTENSVDSNSVDSAAWDIAIFFTKLNDDARRHLANFVAKQAPMPLESGPAGAYD